LRYKNTSSRSPSRSPTRSPTKSPHNIDGDEFAFIDAEIEQSRPNTNTNTNTDTNSEFEPPEDGRNAQLSVDKVAIGVLLFVFFVHFYSFAIQETIITPLVINLYRFPQTQVNLLFVGVGVLSLLTSTAQTLLSRYCSDRLILLNSLILGLAGSVILCDNPLAHDDDFLSLWRFLLGFGLITVAFPLGRTVTLSIYSGVLGEIEQGFYMGLMLAIGAIPRAFGPFWAVESLDLVVDSKTGEYHTWLCFAFNGALFVVSLFLVSSVELSPTHGGGDKEDGASEEEGWNENGSQEQNETTPILANTRKKNPNSSTKNYHTPSTSKTLSERRNSFRPALVAQMNQEFPSSEALTFYTPAKK